MIFRNSCLILVMAIFCMVDAGPNQGARLEVDLLPQTPETDSVDTVSASTITCCIRIRNAVNLDSYQFDLVYDPLSLQFVAGAEESISPYIPNILKSNGGSTVGFMCVEKSAEPGVLNISNTLAWSDSSVSPDGDGVLAVVLFNVKSFVTCTLTCAQAHIGDYEGVFDVLDLNGSALLVQRVVSVNNRVMLLPVVSRKLPGLYSLQGRYTTDKKNGAAQILIKDKRTFLTKTLYK